jgi:hypothetical protein
MRGQFFDITELEKARSARSGRGLSVRHGVASRNQVQFEPKASQNFAKSELITRRGCVSSSYNNHNDRGIRGDRNMTKVDDALSVAALQLCDFGSSSGFTEQQLLAGLTMPAIADPILLDRLAARPSARTARRRTRRIGAPRRREISAYPRALRLRG